MELRRLTSALAFAVAVAAAPAAFAADNAEDFYKKAAAANQFEIETGRIAADNAVSPAVKQFAQKLVDAHTSARAELEAQAKVAGLNVAAPVLNDDQLKDIDNLRRASAQDLEKDFIELQQDAHQDAVDLFQNYAENGDNATLKAFAAKMIPDLRTHLAEAEQLDRAR